MAIFLIQYSGLDKGDINMAGYQHILVATDLSEQSDELMQQALTLAKLWEAKLSMVHVVDYGPMMYGGGEFAIPLDSNIESDLAIDAKQKLQVKSRQIGIAEGDQWILQGQAKDEIITLAKKISADLIMVGGHDQRWLSLLFGSTANAILHNMPCDVLTIRLPDPTSSSED